MIVYLFGKVTFLALFMASITRMKYSVRTSTVIMVAFNVAIWIANYVIFIWKGTTLLVKIFPLTVAIPELLCLAFVSRSTGFKILFTFLTIFIFSMLVSFIRALVSFLNDNMLLQFISDLSCYVIILFFMIKFFRKPYFKMLETLEKGWALLCLFPCLLIVMVYVLQFYPTYIQSRPENIPIVLLIFALTFVFYMIIYLNFRNISEYFQLRQDRKMLMMQMEMHKKEYSALLDNVNSARIFRHDMRHHINTINTLLNDRNIPEAQKYIRRLDDTLDSTAVETYCENYCVNVILSSLAARARSERIEMACDVQLPDNIAVDGIELGLVFANAIENAINACRKIENAANKKISVLCKEHGGQIFIRISNPYVGAVLFDGEYPVSGGADHGIGTRSIAAIAEKHGGVFSFSAQDGVFKTTVTLKY